MFPRKKKNRTGTISVVVVDKSRGGFKEVKSFGVAKTEVEADRLYAKASEWVRRYGGQQEIDFAQSNIVQQEFLESERVLNNRVGAWGLVPHATSHTTVQAVPHTAVPTLDAIRGTNPTGLDSLSSSSWHWI